MLEQQLTYDLGCGFGILAGASKAVGGDEKALSALLSAANAFGLKLNTLVSTFHVGNMVPNTTLKWSHARKKITSNIAMFFIKSVTLGEHTYDQEDTLTFVVEYIVQLETLHKMFPDDKTIVELTKFFKDTRKDNMAELMMVDYYLQIVTGTYAIYLEQQKLAKRIIGEKGFHQFVEFNHPTPACDLFN